MESIRSALRTAVSGAGVWGGIWNASGRHLVAVAVRFVLVPDPKRDEHTHARREHL